MTVASLEPSTRTCFTCKEKYLPHAYGVPLCPKCYLLEEIRNATSDIKRVTDNYYEKTKMIIENFLNMD